MTRRELIDLVEVELKAAFAQQPLDVRATLADATKVGAAVVQRLAHCRREIVALKETVVVKPLVIIGLRERLSAERQRADSEPEHTDTTPTEAGYGGV